MYNYAIIQNRITKINEFVPSEKEVILMLRGLSRSYKGWMGLEEELSDKFDIICIDLPGVGISKSEKLLFKVESMAERIAEVITALKIKKLHIVAPSLGSMVAWEVIKNLPLSKIAGIVILVPSHSGIGLKRISPEGVKTLSMASFLKQEEKLSKLKKLLIGKKSDGKDPFEEDPALEDKWKSIITQDQEELGTKGQLSQLIAAGTYFSKEGMDYVKRNRIPMKFIVATADNLIPSHHGQKIYEYVRHPNSELILLENSGHDFVVTHKEQLMEVIINFMEDKNKFNATVPVAPPPAKNKAMNKIYIGLGLFALGFIIRMITKKNKF